MDIFQRLITAGHTEKDMLVILMFSGQGGIVDGRFHVGGDFNCRRGTFTGNTLDWHHMTELIAKRECDQVHILDCWYTGKATTPYAEVLAATSAAEVATNVLRAHFNKFLVEELKAMDRPTALSSLHARIVAKSMMYGLEHLPVFVGRHERPPIFLQKAYPIDQITDHRQRFNSPRILLTCHLQETLGTKDIATLKRQMSENVPKTVHDIDVCVEGSFKTNSSLLLISVPVEVWSYLPKTSALNFVGLINSRNELLGCGAEEVQELSIQPWMMELESP
ncbi:hypothetical protein K470DRAFT_269719 [Piedraia hortae CBS 480.64]|uniref:Uncharacterized protein n=1 Tax=Piedraia hortae CBS 480.64 TaxID=1314780 RepID=A0A6A7C3M5_9PEZI|nr:hypothetical protein K470DRAFT_269719 [Piedraia hortae CBS 480.64]